jgi:sugar phosphate isomerase/epimerase
VVKTTDRRHFLVSSGMVALAVAGEGALGKASAQAPPAHAALQTKMPRLFTGLCAFSFGSLFKSGQMTFESFFERAIELKADAVDVTGYYLKSAEPTYLNHLRNLALRNGLPFTGVACGATLLPPRKDRRAETIAELKKWIDITQQLAASHLRIFSGKHSSEMSQAQAVDTVVEIMKQAADYAAEKGVILGLENQKGITETADLCLEIMHRVSSPFAGITLDITHFVPTPTQDNYAQIAACASVATQTHIRSGKFDNGTSIDLDHIWRIFAESGYRGYMSVEYESQDRSEAQINNDVPKLMEECRRLCRTYSTA